MAVPGKVDICNMALDHFGKPSIVSLTEGSAEAQACGRQYDIARRSALVRSPWTFARRHRKLAELTVNPLEDTWQFRYDLPNDCLKLHQLLLPGERASRNRPASPHYIEEGTVYTDLPSVCALYILDSTDVLSWNSMFDEVVALALALRLAPAFTRRKSDIDTLMDMFREMLNEAIEEDAAQDTEQYTVYRGGYVDARDSGGGGGGPQTDGSTIWGS